MQKNTLCLVCAWENNVWLLDLQKSTMQNIKGKSQKTQSCFMIWHEHTDKIIKNH
jgi:hypothetical protein